MSDKSREAFEAWYLDSWGTDADLHGLPALDQWLSWQASRKQALAEAAKACASVCTPNLNSYGDGYNQAAIDCEKSIKELK